MRRPPNISAHAKKEELLSAVFTLCGLDLTLGPAELAKLVDRSKRRAEAKIRKLNPGRVGTVDLDALGHVVYRWQRTSKYLDDDGMPLWLPVRGPGPSLQTLFRETGHANYFTSGIKHLSE